MGEVLSTPPAQRVSEPVAVAARADRGDISSAPHRAVKTMPTAGQLRLRVSRPANPASARAMAASAYLAYAKNAERPRSPVLNLLA